LLTDAPNVAILSDGEQQMTIALEIAPEVEARIAEQAERLGLSVPEYARQVVEQNSVRGAVFPRVSPQQRAARFLQWAAHHDPDTPLLTDEEISREALYGRRT